MEDLPDAGLQTQSNEPDLGTATKKPEENDDGVYYRCFLCDVSSPYFTVGLRQQLQFPLEAEDDKWRGAAGDRRVEEEPGREDQSQGRGGGDEEEGDEREGKKGSGGLVSPLI